MYIMADDASFNRLFVFFFTALVAAFFVVSASVFFFAVALVLLLFFVFLLVLLFLGLLLVLGRLFLLCFFLLRFFFLRLLLRLFLRLLLLLGFSGRRSLLLFGRFRSSGGSLLLEVDGQALLTVGVAFMVGPGVARLFVGLRRLDAKKNKCIAD